jgi:hypothetical protein
VSKYFPKFCMCTLLFSLFSYKPVLYSCIAIYHVLISFSNALFPYNPVIYISHLLSLNVRDSFPYQLSVLHLSVAISLLITMLFHSFLFSNNILCTTYYLSKSSILCTVLMGFYPEVLLIYLIFISLDLSSLTLTFLSNYTLVISSI